MGVTACDAPRLPEQIEELLDYSRELRVLAGVLNLGLLMLAIILTAISVLAEGANEILF